jgi:LDH2 family malate/lactate/ureidoglycolate dehydrogenase
VTERRADGSGLIPAPGLRTFATRVFTELGVPVEDAAIVADSLVEADLRGVSSHGVLRIPSYVKRILDGGTSPLTRIDVVRDHSAAVLLDANAGLGQVAGVRAMGFAIERASIHGIAIAGVRNSGHFGAAAYYSMRAAREDMIGLVFSNASAGLAPWGARKAMLGNNPWSIAIPADSEVMVVLDLANSVAARGKIRMAAVKGEAIPTGWGADKDGKPTTDAAAALAGLILPMAEHKGSGISIIVDLLTGGLMGGAILDDVGSIDRSARPQGVAHFFAAIDVAAFQDVAAFKKRVDEYCRRVHEAPRAEGTDRIYMPGELEAITSAQRAATGVPVEAAVLDSLRTVANQLGIVFDLTPSGAG